MTGPDQKLYEILASQPNKLRIKLIRESHAIKGAKEMGVSSAQIAKSIDGASSDVVRRGWLALEAAIASGRINAPPRGMGGLVLTPRSSLGCQATPADDLPAQRMRQTG